VWTVNRQCFSRLTGVVPDASHAGHCRAFRNHAERRLYGVSVIDLVSFASASLLFLAVAMAASWFPAGRATLVDPLVALRDQ
jgi:hypothetical protein